MLITKKDAEKMDLILSYLVKNETARVKHKQIQDLLNITFEEAGHIYDSILEYHNQIEPVISIHHASNIAKRPIITEEFLNKGGFVSVYVRQNEMKKHTENKIYQSEIKPGFVKWLRENPWLTFVIAVSGFILGLLSLLISLKIIK